MSHILKFTEWEDTTGWYCNDVKDLTGIAGMWWVPARMLNMSPASFVEWLVKNYKPDKIIFTDNNLLFYSWNKNHYSLMHSYVLYINRVARKKQFFV